MLGPNIAPVGLGLASWSWLAVGLASIGLAFLYKTTTANPGLIPVGYGSDSRDQKEQGVEEDDENQYR